MGGIAFDGVLVRRPVPDVDLEGQGRDPAKEAETPTLFRSRRLFFFCHERDGVPVRRVNFEKRHLEIEPKM